MPSIRGGFRDSVFLSRNDRVLRGVKRTVTLPAPAAGLDWTVAVPPGRQWRVYAAFGTFTTSAIVANRFVGSSITNGNAVIYQLTPVSPQAAGSVNTGYTFVPSNAVVTSSGQSTDNAVPIVDEWLPSGYTLAARTVGIQAGDQWSAVNVALEEVYFDDSKLTTELFSVEDTEYERLTHGG